MAVIGRVRREVPGAAAIITEQCTAHDYTSAGKPAIAWDYAAAREALVSALVTDAPRILDAFTGHMADAAGGQALALLALIAGKMSSRRRAQAVPMGDGGLPVRSLPTG